MAEFLFDLQRFAPPEGGDPGGGGGGGSSSSVSWSGATSITSAGTYFNQTYSSTTDAQCAVLVSLSSGQVNLVNPTVTKSGGPSNAGNNYNFYGINSGIMALPTLRSNGGARVSATAGAPSRPRASAQTRSSATAATAALMARRVTAPRFTSRTSPFKLRQAARAAS